MKIDKNVLTVLFNTFIYSQNVMSLKHIKHYRSAHQQRATSVVDKEFKPYPQITSNINVHLHGFTQCEWRYWRGISELFSCLIFLFLGIQGNLFS